MSSKKYLNDPDGVRLPIKIDSTSNGEFIPRPLEKRYQDANRSALEACDDSARKVGTSRRNFLVSSTGAATTLLTLNACNTASGQRGGGFVLPKEAQFEPDVASSVLEGDEFIFDVQGHHVGDVETWVESEPVYPAKEYFRFFEQASCELRTDDPEVGHVPCLTGESYVKELFLDSDTDVAVLSFFPGPEHTVVPKFSEASETLRLVEQLGTTQRLKIHAPCMPTYAEDLEAMDEIAQNWPVAAWKTYTQYGPNETGFWLDDDLGQTFIDKVRQTGVNKIAVHKGLPFPFFKNNLHYSAPRDVGPAARQNPDITFMIYHSGYDMERPEGPYSRGSGTGVDALINSLLDNGITVETPGNVYAELGTTWRSVMRDADQAAHLLGKLLKYVGEDRILWGTDSIWYGSPQDQIMAFRAFQISEEFQEKYGYPAITDEIRAKIFGLNGARAYDLDPKEVRTYTQTDEIHRARLAYVDEPDPSFLTYGPKTRREFWNFRAQQSR